MTIVTLGSKFYIPTNSGYKEISREMALDMYEKGEVTQEVDLSYEHD